MGKLIVTFLFIASSIITSHAQQIANENWVRLETADSEISFEMPEDFTYIFDTSGFSLTNPKSWTDKIDYSNVRSISSHHKGVSMFFESYDSRRSKHGIEFFLSGYSNAKYSNVKFNSFEGLLIVRESEHYSLLYYFASEKRTYLFGIGSRDKSAALESRFLRSIKLDGKNIVQNTQIALPETAQTLTVDTLKETPVDIVYDSASKKKEEIATGNADTILENKASYSKKPIVLFKPRAPYTDAARQSREQGTIRLRVNLLPNGRIEKITVIKGLKYGLVEKTVNVAKRIKFIPAENENLPVASSITLEYSFTIY